MGRGLGQGSGAVWVVLCLCEVVESWRSLCRWQVQVSVYCAWRIPAHLRVHPVFNPVAPYGYLLSGMYLFMADITNPDFLV